MPEESPTPPPETPAPRRPGQNVGAAFSGETTGSGTNFPTGEETVMMGSGASASAQVIGDFEVLSKLGQGGMGAVYRARQRSLDRQVALKILPATLEADADFVSRFQREARVAASLSHRNLVKVYASGEADGTHFIAMELIEGETLGDLVKRGPLAPAEALRIIGDAARALEYGWQRAQLIHRDIKPGNIFLSQHGDVKVGDLGLAKSMSGDTTGLTQTGTAMGTPHYISPEQARGDKDLDFRADIYSLGCTLYQLLTGRTPYEGRDPMVVMNMHINAPPPAILKVLPGCPIPLARLVGKMLKKIKRERQASYGELIAEIERVAALFTPTASVLESTLPPDPDSTLLATPGKTPRSATPVAVPARSDARSAAPKSKTPLYAGIAAGVVVLGAVAFLFWPKPEKLTKAELYAKQRAAEQATATPAPAPEPTAVKPAAVGVPPAAERWRDVLNHPTTKSDGLQRGAQGASLYGWVSHPIASPDLAIRARVACPAEGAIYIRARVKDTHAYQWAFYQKTGQLLLQRQDKEQFTLLRKFSPQPAPRVGDPVELELRIVGNVLVGKWQGVEVARAEDATWAEPGEVVIEKNKGGEPLEFRALEVLDLSQPPASMQTATAPAAPGERPWVNLITSLEWPAPWKVESGVLTRPAGEKHPWVSLASKLPLVGDGALRARFRRPIGMFSFQLGLRSAVPELCRLNVAGSPNSSDVLVALSHFNLKTNLDGEREQISVPIAIGEPIVCELRVVGSEATVLLNNQVVLRQSNHSPRVGGLYFYTNEGPAFTIEQLEYLNLDAPAAAGTLPSPASAAEPWQDVLASPGRLELFGAATSTSEGLKLPPESAALVEGSASQSDGAISITTPFHRGARGPGLRVRAARGELSRAPRYVLNYQENNEFWLNRLGAGPDVPLARYPAPETLRDGEDYTLELRVVGTHLIAKLNGDVLGEVVDSGLKAGSFGVSTGNRLPTPALIKKLIYLPLDPSLTKSPTTATKDAPFVNGLGMKFVPVPITGGPTGGQRVLFSIWETRVQDYDAFTKETGRAWLREGFTALPNHPAGNTSWEDAQAFCQWLTERERKAGRLGPDERYRLPTSHEWSCAVGIGDREDANKQPFEKVKKIPDVFPWGTQWPPPPGAGNYKGEENTGPLGPNVQAPIVGYRDSFNGSSPVGSFPPNALGLYDLGGNMWEKCEDLFDSRQTKRVSRGQSYSDADRDHLLASNVSQAPPDAHHPNQGFRVVLAPVP